ncbi:MAG: hypothetical protein AAB229_10990 [Candidatus Hydrogenedentota bacterium]
MAWKWKLILIAGVLLIVAILTSWPFPDEQPPPLSSVGIVVAGPRTFSGDWERTVYPEFRRSDLRVDGAKYQLGYVEYVVGEGAFVRKDDVVARVRMARPGSSALELLVDLRESRYTVKSTRRTIEQETKKGRDTRSIALWEKSLRRSEIYLAETQSAIKTRQSAFDLVILRAPFSGIVSRAIRSDEEVEPKYPVVLLEDSSTIILSDFFRDSELKFIDTTLPATITISDMPSETTVGTIVGVDHKGGRLTVIPNHPLRGLIGGSTFKVKYRAGDRRIAVAIPTNSVQVEFIFPDAMLQRVWIERNGSAQSQLVKVGMQHEGWSEILSGVQAGDRVIIPNGPE